MTKTIKDCFLCNNGLRIFCLKKLERSDFETQLRIWSISFVRQ